MKKTSSRRARKATPRKAGSRRKAAAKPRKRRAVARAPRRGGARSDGRPAKPRLAVVRRKRIAPRVAVEPAFPQRAGASAKQLVLFELVRARTAFHGAIVGLTNAAAEQPTAPGKWSVKETVLHLATRDQARLREMEAALRGMTPSWKGVHDPEMAAINAETLAALRHLDWDESVRVLQRTRQHLMDELEMVPEEPAEIWSSTHPFGWMFHVLAPHDLHHAELVKRWRLERGV